MGPFDNDVAADWYGDLEGASPVQRIAALHSAVADVADHGDDYLGYDAAAEAIAAAAVAAAVLAPEVPAHAFAGDLDLDAAAVAAARIPWLAARALDRITGAASEWHCLWAESPKYPLVRAELDELRDRLARQLPDR
jgi:hypothetical protein